VAFPRLAHAPRQRRSGNSGTGGEGTVKAQTNAIYRKAGVSGRPQLLSLFIEDLMDDAGAHCPAADAAARKAATRSA